MATTSMSGGSYGIEHTSGSSMNTGSQRMDRAPETRTYAAYEKRDGLDHREHFDENDRGMGQTRREHVPDNPYTTEYMKKYTNNRHN